MSNDTIAQTPEAVALSLFHFILSREISQNVIDKRPAEVKEKAYYLSLYAECLETVKGKNMSQATQAKHNQLKKEMGITA